MWNSLSGGGMTQARAADSDARHARKVARIAQPLRDRKGTRPVSLRKGVVPHQVPKARDLRPLDDKIDISDLNEVLHVDPERRQCVAEPGVTFENLVTATMKHGLVPIVVPEFKTITIGGAVSGCSIESTSFVYGGFHDNCTEYEVITAKGDVLNCTPGNEHQLIFQMIHGSFGTLGVLSKLVFRLMPAQPFVHVTYEKYGTLENYMAAIERRFRARDVDFMDGIIHSPTEYVLSLGRFVEKAPYTHAYDWMRVYWKSTSTRREDYLKTPDYFFRYNKGVTNVNPKSFLGRLFFGKIIDSTLSLTAAKYLGKYLLSDDKPTVTLDVFIPFSRVPDFLSWYGREFKHFPLWMVPYRRVHDYEWVADSFWTGMKDELFLDLAIYGMRQPGDRNYHRLMEQQLPKVGGVKTLISHNYYPRDEFWSVFNKRHYDAVKAITDPANIFRDLYEKTCLAAMGRTE